MFRDENVSLGTQFELKAREYDAISGNWSVDIDGETKTLQQAKSYLESDDRSIREKFGALLPTHAIRIMKS